YIAGGGRGAVARFLVIAFIVFDLHSFTNIFQNKIQVARTGTDQLERLISMRGAADFLKAQPGPFRVQVMADPPLNLGDAYGIETINGGAVTLASNYMDLMNQGGPGIDLLNVRYFVKPAAAAEPNPVYADANWKIYRNPGARARAWIDNGKASVEEHSARHIAVKVQASSAGVLVLSELFYPGWEARVNGTPATVREVAGGLRGIPVLAGESQVTVDYAPKTVRLGGILSGLTFALTLLAGALWLRR
ncbi:MAG: YfhO family protein, partial [Acidobacteriota bacterium]|nr:YfhO family protein [Acidobacteriota bacterium]